MVRNWYSLSKAVTSMRKHVLRVDLRMYPGDETSSNSIPELENKIKGFLTASIIKGLDVVGVVSSVSATTGNVATELTKKLGFDLFVLGGQEYKTTDGFNVIGFNAKDNIPSNLNYDQFAQFVRERNGIIMVFKLSKRQMQQINKIENAHVKPDLIEIYDAITGSYQDIHTEYPCVISSAARSSKELETLNLFTLMPRKEAESMKLIPQQYGVDFTPNYLKTPEEIQQGVN